MLGRALIIGMLLLVGVQAQAALTCQDVDYDNPHYHENMDNLAKAARFPDQYWNRLQADAVRAVCHNDQAALDAMVSRGDVKGSVVMTIKEELGKTDRDDSGISYQYSKKRFLDMGLCSACADNVAQHYVKQPDSKCGTLARHALEGQPRAMDRLRSFPDYCQWDYSK